MVLIEGGSAFISSSDRDELGRQLMAMSNHK
jgi:hypothetical protein